MKQLKMKAMDWYSDFLYRVKNRGEDKWSLVCNDGRLELLKNNRKVTVVELSDIVRITSYKKDLITFDPVCLHFLDKHGISLEIREDMDGFKKFINEQLNNYFDVESGWLLLVNKGSFTENDRVIWER